MLCVNSTIDIVLIAYGWTLLNALKKFIQQISAVSFLTSNDVIVVQKVPHKNESKSSMGGAYL